MCISILTITTRDSAKNNMTKLTPRFFITILAFAIFGSLIYLSYFANDKMMYAFSASENSTSNETSTNNNTNINSNSTENLTALIPSNFSTLDMNSTNVTTITAPSNSNFSTRPMNNTNATTTSTGVSNSNVTLLYEYPDLGFKIKYPPSWEKVQYGRAVKAYGEGVIANLLSPLENSEDKFKDYVLIKIENLTSPQLGKTPANNSIGGKPTYQVVFERPNLANKSDTIRIMKEWIPLNDKALVIELDAEKSRFAHYLPLAMEMINSIELNGVGSSPAVTSTNQSLPLQQQSNVTTSSPEEATVSADNNTKTSSVIEKLLKRDIDKNETAFESQAGNEINTTK
jgi:hypothetical protein